MNSSGGADEPSAAWSGWDAVLQECVNESEVLTESEDHIFQSGWDALLEECVNESEVHTGSEDQSFQSGWDAFLQECVNESAVHTGSEDQSFQSGWDAVLQECLNESEVQTGSQDHVFQASSVTKAPRRGGCRKVGNKVLRDHLAKLDLGNNEEGGSTQLVPLSGIEYARQCRAEAAKKKKQQQQQHISRGTTVDASALCKFGYGETLLTVGSSLQRALGGVMLKSLQLSIDMHDEVLDNTLQGKTLTSSSQSIGAIMNKTKKHVQDKLIRAGAALCETGTWLWAGFLTNLLQTGHKPILFVIRLRYDETPTKVRVVETPNDGHVFAPKSKIGTELLAQIMQSLAAETLPQHEAPPATHAKILQTEMQIAVLFKNPNGEKNEESFTYIQGPVPTSLQAVDHLTGETTRACVWSSISSVPEIERIWKMFPMRVRLSCTDKAGANFRCEAGLQEEGYMPDVTSCHVPCDVHRLSTSIGVSNKTVQTDVSGVLNCGLVCNEVGATRRFREFLKEIFLQELHIVHDSPPGTAKERRDEIYNLFLPITGVTLSSRKSNLKRRKILSTFLNGTLLEECCTHYCEGCCASIEETHAYFASFVSWALIPFNLPIYSRKSWVGQNFSLEWIGILDSHHHLFSRLMEMYVGKAQVPIVPLDPISDCTDTSGWMSALLDECSAGVAETAKAKDFGDTRGMLFEGTPKRFCF